MPYIIQLVSDSTMRSLLHAATGMAYLSADARICRIADVAPPHIYALAWMPGAAAAIANSASPPRGDTPDAEYKCPVVVGRAPADRLVLSVAATACVPVINRDQVSLSAHDARITRYRERCQCPAEAGGEPGARGPGPTPGRRPVRTPVGALVNVRSAE